MKLSLGKRCRLAVLILFGDRGALYFWFYAMRDSYCEALAAEIYVPLLGKRWERGWELGRRRETRWVF